MPAIRWMNYAGPYLGLQSLIWEFEKDLDMEVSAEWTIKNRPFKIPFKNNGLVLGNDVLFGLLLKSSAIHKRFRCDGGSGGPIKGKKQIPKRWRTKNLNPELLTIKPWEALCEKRYASLILIKNKIDYNVNAQIKEAMEYVTSIGIPVLIYQEHKNYDSGATSSWSLEPYTSHGCEAPDI